MRRSRSTGLKSMATFLTLSYTTGKTLGLPGDFAPVLETFLGGRPLGLGAFAALADGAEAPEDFFVGGRPRPRFAFCGGEDEGDTEAEAPDGDGDGEGMEFIERMGELQCHE